MKTVANSSGKWSSLFSQTGDKFLLAFFWISLEMISGWLEFKNLCTRNKAKYNTEIMTGIASLAKFSLSLPLYIAMRWMALKMEKWKGERENEKKKFVENFCAKDTTMRSELIWNSTANFFCVVVVSVCVCEGKLNLISCSTKWMLYTYSHSLLSPLTALKRHFDFAFIHFCIFLTFLQGTIKALSHFRLVVYLTWMADWLAGRWENNFNNFLFKLHSRFNFLAIHFATL